MNVLIAGATGFVGRHLVEALLADRHEVLVLGRRVSKIKSCFADKVVALDWQMLEAVDPGRVDAVINLCGANIGDKRWTKARKQMIIDSRVQTSRVLAQWCATAKIPPKLLNASAVGIYGVHRGAHEVFNELATDQDDSFLCQVAQAWEAAAQSQLSVSVTIMRFGVVLKRGEGMLKQLAPSFAMGLGGVLGSGQQMLSWIAVEDLIRAIQFLLKHSNITGEINLCSPNPISQHIFAKTLAKIMHRPCFFSLPCWVLKLMFGQMARELLLGGQAAIPARMVQKHFRFCYATIEAVLKHNWAE